MTAEEIAYEIISGKSITRAEIVKNIQAYADQQTADKTAIIEALYQNSVSMGETNKAMGERLLALEAENERLREALEKILSELDSTIALPLIIRMKIIVTEALK